MTRADLIIHPIRMRLIIALHDRKLTPKQLAAELKDVASATLYHHLNLLTHAGITQVVEERLVHGTLREKVYTLSDASTLLSPDQIAGASKDELLQYFLVFVSKLIGDHARYLDLKESGYYTDAGYHQHLFYLSDEEFVQFRQELNATLLPWLTKGPAPGRSPRLLTTILIPQLESERIERMTDQDSYGESSEVNWQLDSTTVYGTLVRPVGPGPFPAVVMVAGSGPTDRDWNSPLLPGSNGSARLLAEALARAGIASLRYDKRASGPHARENVPLLIGKMSMQSHVDELAGAVRVMASQEYVRSGRIFALANSEGTLHALNYQLHNPEIPFAGLVLTGPPGRAVGTVARAQLAAQAASIPNGEALLALYDAAIVRFMAGESIIPDQALPQGVQMLLQSLETPANLPLARELWMANAAPLLRQVNVPVLVIIGKKDLQINWQADGEPLKRAAAGHENVTFLFPENANHVLKEELRPRQDLVPAEITESYNGPATRLDQETLASILAWLAAHA